MILTMNKHLLELSGKYLSLLQEANELLDDSKGLHARFEKDGYLIIRGLHTHVKIELARQFLLERLDENEQLDNPMHLCREFQQKANEVYSWVGIKTVTHNQFF